jgi:hypothetical protein
MAESKIDIHLDNLLDKIVNLLVICFFLVCRELTAGLVIPAVQRGDDATPNHMMYPKGGGCNL